MTCTNNILSSFRCLEDQHFSEGAIFFSCVPYGIFLHTPMKSVDRSNSEMFEILPIKDFFVDTNVNKFVLNRKINYFEHKLLIYVRYIHLIKFF